jgi:hypothetical protein
MTFIKLLLSNLKISFIFNSTKYFHRDEDSIMDKYDIIVDIKFI